MQYRKLSEIKKLPDNPRIIKNKEFKTLCDSIRDNPKFFEARPIILSNRTGDLIAIAGNQRYEAAKAIGLKEAPTFLMEGLTEAKEQEITIRDNVFNGEWDMGLLSTWAEDKLADWGVKLPEDWFKEQKESKEIQLKESYQYQIILDCESESQQAEMIDEFRKKGFSCRPLIL